MVKPFSNAMSAHRFATVSWVASETGHPVASPRVALQISKVCACASKVADPEVQARAPRSTTSMSSPFAPMTSLEDTSRLPLTIMFTTLRQDVDVAWCSCRARTFDPCREDFWWVRKT